MKKRPYLYKRILSALIVATLLTGSVGSAVYASQLEDAKDKRDEAQANLDKVNKEIEKLNKEQKELQEQMDAYDEALIALLTDLTLLSEDIDKKEAEIQQAEVDLVAAEQREAEQYDAMKLRIQYMYENSSHTSLWTALVESKSIMEALNRAEYINGVYKYDREQLTAYQETVQEVIELKEKLDEEMIALGELKVNMEEQQKELENLLIASAEKMENMEEQVADATALAKKYAKTIKQQNKVIASEEARIAAEKAAAANKNNTGSNANAGGGLTGGANPSYSSNVSGADIVNYASKFVGNPYVYGGTSLTEGCDCSYFTKAVYGNFGITLPRTSYDQRSCGQEVSYANAKAGDIICYAGHVAIYMGDDKIVHAANSRLGICYGKAKYRTIICVRRVL